MGIKSTLKKFFLNGEIKERVTSPINGEIVIFEDFFGRWMRIGGVSQSGGLVVEIWKKALGEVQRCKGTKVQSILVLGLGCGNAAQLVAKKWPGVKIVGVELDPEVIEMGKKYFALDKINNLEIIIADAIKYINNDHKQKFDLILVDLYLGKQFPEEAESEKFLNNIKETLSDNGMVVFNRFYWSEYKRMTDNFKEKMEKIFPKVWFKKTVSNKLLFASLS